MGRQRAENLHRDLSKERQEESRDVSNRSLKTDGETESGNPTQVSLERERGRERKRGTAAM